MLILYLLYCNLTQQKEHFDATSDAIKTAINTRYGADVEAIRNLSDIASRLIAGGLTVPGNLSVNGTLNMIGNTIDFATGVPNREGNDGKIVYGVWDNALNIIGKGATYGTRTVGLGDNVIIHKNLNIVGDTPSDGSPQGNITAKGTASFADGKVTIDAAGNVTIKGNLFMNGKIVLDDNPIMIRKVDDENHTIRFNEALNGPLITGCINVGIKAGNCNVGGGLNVDGNHIKVSSGANYIQLNSKTTKYGGSSGTSMVSSNAVLQIIGNTTDPTGNSGGGGCSYLPGNRTVNGC